MGWDGDLAYSDTAPHRHADDVAKAFRTYSGELRRYLTRRLGCPQTAEDLIQEVFIRLHRMQRPSEVIDLRPYLYRIAGNLMIDHARASRAKSQPTSTVDIDLVPEMRSDDVGGEALALMRDQLRQVEAVVAELSESCGRMFWMSRAEGLYNYEIAEHLGVCLSTVEKNINRATRHCRGRLADMVMA